MDILKQKRQYFHQLLLKLNEVKYKDVIVEAAFGVTSTSEITDEWKMNKLISDAENRLKQRNQSPSTPQKNDKQIRTWRNRCLQVLTERGITATARNWEPVNHELSKKQYQWIMPEGQINYRGLYVFRTVEDLKKLFKQLCIIRDNEKNYNQKIINQAFNN